MSGLLNHLKLAAHILKHHEKVLAIDIPAFVQSLSRSIERDAASRIFRFLDLPAELRLMVYDELFTHMLQENKKYDHTTWHNEKYWPKQNHYSDYLRLILVCKEVGAEVTKHWRDHYAARCVFWFTCTLKLYRVATSRRRLGRPYDQATYYLTHSGGDSQCTMIDYLMYDMMTAQDERADLEEGGFWEHFGDRDFNSTLGSYEPEPGFHFTFYHERNGRKACTLTATPNARCQSWYHDIDDDEAGFCAVMRGEVSKMTLDHYDASTAREKQLFAHLFAPQPAQRLAHLIAPQPEDNSIDWVVQTVVDYDIVQETKWQDEFWLRLSRGQETDD